MGSYGNIHVSMNIIIRYHMCIFLAHLPQISDPFYNVDKIVTVVVLSWHPGLPVLRTHENMWDNQQWRVDLHTWKPCMRCMACLLHEGVHKWWIPNSWMIFLMENPTETVIQGYNQILGFTSRNIPWCTIRFPLFCRVLNHQTSPLRWWNTLVSSATWLENPPFIDWPAKKKLHVYWW